MNPGGRGAGNPNGCRQGVVRQRYVTSRQYARKRPDARWDRGCDSLNDDRWCRFRRDTRFDDHSGSLPNHHVNAEPHLCHHRPRDRTDHGTGPWTNPCERGVAAAQFSRRRVRPGSARPSRCRNHRARATPARAVSGIRLAVSPYTVFRWQRRCRPGHPCSTRRPPQWPSYAAGPDAVGPGRTRGWNRSARRHAGSRGSAAWPGPRRCRRSAAARCRGGVSGRRACAECPGRSAGWHCCQAVSTVSQRMEFSR
jgi:hypothetical protein